MAIESGSKHEFAIMPTPPLTDGRYLNSPDSPSETESRIKASEQKNNLNAVVDTQFLDQMANDLNAKAQQALRPYLNVPTPPSNEPFLHSNPTSLPTSFPISQPMTPKSESNPTY